MPAFCVYVPGGFCLGVVFHCSKILGRSLTGNCVGVCTFDGLACSWKKHVKLVHKSAEWGMNDANGVP